MFQTVAELVDWHWTHDLYKGLHFPACDIPAQVSTSALPTFIFLCTEFRPVNSMLSVSPSLLTEKSTYKSLRSSTAVV